MGFSTTTAEACGARAMATRAWEPDSVRMEMMSGFSAFTISIASV